MVPIHGAQDTSRFHYDITFTSVLHEQIMLSNPVRGPAGALDLSHLRVDRVNRLQFRRIMHSSTMESVLPF